MNMNQSIARTIPMVFGCFLLASTVPLAAAESPQDGLLFHASFDQGVKADFAKGNPEPVVKGNVVQDTGIKGKSLLTGKNFVTELGYENEGNFSAPQGTVSFWIKPVDWLGDQGTAKIFNLFMQGIPGKGYFGLEMLRGENNQLMLIIFSVQFPDRDNIYFGHEASVAWQNGQLHHLLFAWDRKEMRLYVDGVAGRTGKITQPFEAEDLKARHFLLGCSGDEHTAIDEVRIWDRPLSAEEIAQLSKH